MPRATVLKGFPFSRTGTDTHTAVAGVDIDVPDHLVDGLAREGFIRMYGQKGAGAAPENKAEAAAPENKTGGGNVDHPLVAKHRGRGSWSIMDGEEEVVQGLTREQAEAFNALPAHERETAALELAGA